MTFAGVRVLDLSRLAPGPYATRVLAELGAEVIKIEAPNGGDYARWSPPLSGDPPTSGMFRELNAGKKSVALDLKQPAGQAAFRALLAGADVLVDGNRPGVLARLGLDPQALMDAHPRLIFCALTGFGLTGPHAGRAGHDVGYLARAGVIGLCGPAEAPVSLGVQVADIGAALAAVAGIAAALYERTRTGRGTVVDISLTEAGLAFNALNFGGLHAGVPPRRGREVLDGSRPCYSVYRTKDGRFLAVGALEPKFWMKLCQAVELPELASDGLDTGPRGVEVKARLQARLLERTADEWMALLEPVDCCVEKILDLEEVEADPQHRARHVTTAGGWVRSPIRVDDWSGLGGPAAELAPSPDLGADTERVLREAGVDDATLAAVLEK
jgi:alpha-methylacyl-CoA racemase